MFEMIKPRSPLCLCRILILNFHAGSSGPVLHMRFKEREDPHVLTASLRQSWHFTVKSSENKNHVMRGATKERTIMDHGKTMVSWVTFLLCFFPCFYMTVEMYKGVNLCSTKNKKKTSSWNVAKKSLTHLLSGE